ncbi:hypothetical protein ACP4OV_019266 [Aristida adscensionis]
MPELVLCGRRLPGQAPSALLDSVDAALGAYSAPTLRRLGIELLRGSPCDVPAHRLAPWLRFASQRLAGALDLSLPMPADALAGGDGELPLPLCELATRIRLVFWRRFVLRPPPAGSFTALTDLQVIGVTMDGRELGRLVSSQCPRLRSLTILVELVALCDEKIAGLVKTGKLEVAAPILEEISVFVATKQAYIDAPKLEKAVWRNDAYDPLRHQFAVARRHIRSLWINQSSALLMRRFDTVEDLRLEISIPEGIEGYKSLGKETDKFPVCETLGIVSWGNYHAFAPNILHFLKRFSPIRKLKLSVDPHYPATIEPCNISSCPCQSHKVDNIIFNSLEDIEICYFTGSYEQANFIGLLLSGCNLAKLKRVKIAMAQHYFSSRVKEVCEMIRRTCSSNCKVELSVLTNEGRVPFS